MVVLAVVAVLVKVMVVLLAIVGVMMVAVVVVVFSHDATTTNMMRYRPPKECQYYEHTWHAPELTRRLLVRTQPLSAHEFELTSTS